MGQGQDSQHEEIHGQQEVDVLLGEYLRQRYKEKQEVRVVGGYEETRLPAFLLEMVSPLWSWGNSVRKNLKWYWEGGGFQFLWQREKGKDPQALRYASPSGCQESDTTERLN